MGLPIALLSRLVIQVTINYRYKTAEKTRLAPAFSDEWGKKLREMVRRWTANGKRLFIFDKLDGKIFS